MRPLYEFINTPLKVHFEYERYFLMVEYGTEVHYFLLWDKNDEIIEWSKISKEVRDEITATFEVCVKRSKSIYGCENEVIALVKECEALAEVGTNHRGYDVGNVCFVWRKSEPEWVRYSR